MGPDSSIISTAILITVCTFFVGLRTFLITRYNWSARISEATLLASWLSTVTAAGCIFWRCFQELKYAADESVAVVKLTGMPLSLLSDSLKVTVLESFMYFSALWFVKISFVAMYFNMTSALSKRLKWSLFLTGSYTISSMIVVVLMVFLWCRPFARNWNIGPAFCAAITDNRFLYISTALNISNDLIVMIVPMFILRRLHIGRREQMAVLFLLFLGALTVSAAVTRMIILQRTEEATPGTSSAVHKTEVCSLVEVTVCTIAACMPSLRAFFLQRQRRRQTMDFDESNDREKRGSEVPLPENESAAAKGRILSISTVNSETPLQLKRDTMSTMSVTDRVLSMSTIRSDGEASVVHMF